MSSHGGTRSRQRGAVLLGLAGGMLIVSAGFTGAYYVLGSKGEARAAGNPPEALRGEAHVAAVGTGALGAFVKKSVEVKVGGTSEKLSWAELGIEIDPGEADRAPVATDADLATLAARASIPVRIDREAAIKTLLQLKGKTDASPSAAYLDLETREIHADSPGQGIDLWASLPRIEAAARQNATSVELVRVAIPARVTKETLGIDDISHVMGHYLTRFPVTDRDRNFNLKLAASKLNGVVLKPHEEWSFNGTVGERSEKEGYKIAHVIDAGEMVDGLAGGTCQISTTLFGAAFFAGLDIVKTTNHSRPSAYTPLGFDATVVWPNTDLKLKNPYDFPVVIHYRVANGEALVEILGKERPWDKVSFGRHIVEDATLDYPIEERPDEDMAEGSSSLDQAGFKGYTIVRTRQFYKGKTVDHTDHWTVVYKPVTEYVRVGRSTDPNAKVPVEREIHRLQVPGGNDDGFSQ